MKEVQDVLDRLVPEPASISDWEAVLRDARLRRRSSAFQLAVATGAIALVALFLVAPWKSTERLGVLERALAAVGDGPVTHLILRDEWGGTLVELETGARKPLYNERELWIDPDRGFAQVVRFGGVVTHRHVAGPREIEHAYAVLASGYREALESGRARLVGDGVVDSIPVHWIEVLREAPTGAGDGKDHVWAVEVAVSQDSYKPVYVRDTRDGEAGEFAGSRILVAERLPAGSGDFSRSSRHTGYGLLDGSSAEPFSPERALEIFGPRGVWLGAEFANLRPIGVGELTLMTGYSRETGTWAERLTGIRVVYAGSTTGEGLPAETPSITIQQTPRRHPTLDGLTAYDPPQGHVVLTPGGQASRYYEGTYVTIRALAGKRSEELALAAARALRPLSDESGAGG
jgi:hypothetical protein